MQRNNSFKLGEDPDYLPVLALAVSHDLGRNLLLGRGLRSLMLFSFVL